MGRSPFNFGAIQVLRNADGGGGGGGVRLYGKKRYEGVRFNVISVTRGWVGVQFPEKKALRNSWMAPFVHTAIRRVTVDGNREE